MEKKMKLNRFPSIAAWLVVWSLLFIGTVPLFAHHSFDAEYDSNKPITITGYVTKLDWNNPHAFVFLDTKDANGLTKSFKVEMGPPYALTRGGWTRDILKIGDKIIITDAALAKDGTNAAGSMPSTSMTLASGKKLVMR
jgi:hypothetical protein